MRMQLKILTGIALSFFVLNSYAISVNVQTSSKDVSALGFTTNGKNYGGMGKSYQKSNMVAGTYTFGVRVGGLTGTDVGCTSQGKEEVSINNDATVTLNYDSKKCSMLVSSKK
jgi:uncharacterized protein YegJ (DUF2314 family)